MEIKKNIPTERIGEKRIPSRIILLLFSLSFSIAIMFLCLIPQYEQMQIKEMEIKLTQETLASKENIFTKIASFNRTYKDISETEINKMYNLLPDENNSEEHLANIDKLAKLNGILIKDISFSEHREQLGSNTNEDTFKTAHIFFSVRSDFPSFMSFLSSLEKSIPTASIKNISITKGETSEDIEINEDIEAEIEMAFYHL